MSTQIAPPIVSAWTDALARMEAEAAAALPPEPASFAAPAPADGFAAALARLDSRLADLAARLEAVERSAQAEQSNLDDEAATAARAVQAVGEAGRKLAESLARAV